MKIVQKLFSELLQYNTAKTVSNSLIDLSHMYLMHNHMHSHGNGEECVKTVVLLCKQSGHVPHAHFTLHTFTCIVPQKSHVCLGTG